MERRVFTYKDVEEAKKYIGKKGRFGDNLGYIVKNINDGRYDESVLTEVDPDNTAFPFEFEGCHRRVQFFSPDPEPVEKWVPFTAEDWREYMGKVVEARGSMGRHHRVVTRHTTHGVYLDGSFVSFQEFVDNWQNLDSTPCGKKVTE